VSDEKQKFVTLGEGEDRHVVPVGPDGKLRGDPPPHIAALIHAGTKDPAKKAAWAEKLEKPAADHSAHREAVLKHLESSKTATAHEADIGGKKVKLTPGEMRLTQAAGVHARPWIASSECVPDVHVRESFTREQGSRSGRGRTNWTLQERAPEEAQKPAADPRVTSAVEAESGVRFGRRNVARAEEQLTARKADADRLATVLAGAKGTHLESGHKHPHKMALAMVAAAARELDDERAKLEDTLASKTRMHSAIFRGKDRGEEIVRQAREIKDPAEREKFLRDARERSGSSGVEEAVDAELAQSGTAMPAPSAFSSAGIKDLQELSETIQARGKRHGPSTARDVAESNTDAVDDALADIHKDARRQGVDPHAFTAHHLGEHGPVLAKHYPDKFPGIAPASDSAPAAKPPAPVDHKVSSMDASKLAEHHAALLEEQRKLTQRERLGTAKASDRDRQAQLVHEIADAGGEKHRRAKEAVQTAERAAHAKDAQEKQRWGSLSEAERQAIVSAGGTRSDWRTREQRRHDDNASYLSKELERQQARMDRTKDPESRAEYAPGLEQARQDAQSHLSKPRPEAPAEIHAAQQRHPGSVPDHEAALRAIREKHGLGSAPDDWHTFAAKHPDVAGQISDVLQGHPQRKVQMSLMARAHQKHGEEQKEWDKLVTRTPFEHKTFRAPTTTKSAVDLHGAAYGGLVAHKDDAGDWAVSHLGSGLRLNQAPLESEQTAKRGLLAAHGLAARDAQSSVDWTKANVTKEPGFKRVAQDIEASVHAPSDWAHYAANEGLHWGNRGGAADVLKRGQDAAPAAPAAPSPAEAYHAADEAWYKANARHRKRFQLDDRSHNTLAGTHGHKESEAKVHALAQHAEALREKAGIPSPYYANTAHRATAELAPRVERKLDEKARDARKHAETLAKMIKEYGAGNSGGKAAHEIESDFGVSARLRTKFPDLFAAEPHSSSQ